MTGRFSGTTGGTITLSLGRITARTGSAVLANLGSVNRAEIFRGELGTVFCCLGLELDRDLLRDRDDLEADLDLELLLE